ncbi:MAG: lysoplasmalogenase [Chloroflexi bacterium]|jgi:alkenylglycerophosphocholine/alkenylglycerophosphoethanolamine hydrolase|nr:lysoplasmalogenase [Anaerolineaceae bacterium]NMB87604.1 lysoplasmalogenase [Chloroflexota bacterium]
MAAWGGWLLIPTFVLVLALAVCDWVAVRFHLTQVVYVAKPATLLALILWSWQASGWPGAMLWFGAGLVFSLLGDILLMLPARFFLGGLGAFLLAHLCYVFGFNVGGLPRTPLALLPLLLIGVLGWGILEPVFRALRAQPYRRRLILPVMSYGVAVGAVLYSALLTPLRPEWPPLGAALAVGGAVLFFVSDSLLAHDRFVRKLPDGRMWVHVTYHLGQIGLVAGALLAYG